MCSVELVADDRPATLLRLPSDTNELRSVRLLIGSDRVELKSVQPHHGNGFATLEILIKAPPALCPGCSATSPKSQNDESPLPTPSPATPQVSSPEPADIRKGEEEEERRLRVREEWVKKMRVWLMVVAMLVASMAFQAGVSPPKIFDDDDDVYWTANYWLFMVSNSLAFGFSLGSIILLMGENTFQGRFKLQAVRVFVVGAIFALAMAICFASYESIMWTLIFFCGLFVFLVFVIGAFFALAVAFCFACYESIVSTLVFFGALFVFLEFVSMLTWWYNTKRGEAMLWRLRSIGFSLLFRRRNSIRAADESL